MKKIVIIGGGLAGLISSIQLIRAGVPCTLIEKKSYPFHRVCGEYVSNEALPFLTASALYPKELDLPQIHFLEVSSTRGRTTRLALDLGGFGISRYTFDSHLFNIARREGVSFMLDTEVTGVEFEEDAFSVRTKSAHLRADLVIGAFGKRSRIDRQQDRSFIKKRSPWVGVKYHVRTDHPHNVIALHNFPGGYCGVCNVDGGLTNLCYLTHRSNLRLTGEVREMEHSVLFTNPVIRDLFRNSEFVFDKPEVINEISFETKNAVDNHILMVGDAAGMITPVCGNGMAIAIHSGKIAAGLVSEYYAGKSDRHMLETRYERAWKDHFKYRIWFGRTVQRLFVHRFFSDLVAGVARFGPIARPVMRNTHGKPF